MECVNSSINENNTNENKINHAKNNMNNGDDVDKDGNLNESKKDNKERKTGILQRNNDEGRRTDETREETIEKEDTTIRAGIPLTISRDREQAPAKLPILGRLG